MKKMQMTRFFCQELLYDYVSGELSSERKAEVDAFLKTDEVCREDLARIKQAMVYCKHLSEIKTPDEWVARWQNLPPALAKRISNWELKIVSKLWMALPYTVSVVVIVLGMVIFKPWRTLFKKEVIVWSATSNETLPATVAPVPTPPATPAPVVAATPPPAVTTPPPASAPTHETKEALLKSEELGPPEKIEEIASTTIFGSPREVAPPKLAKQEPVPDTKQAANQEVEEETQHTPAPLKEAQKGELYRWFVQTDNFETVTNNIKEKILALNGEKARKVELGWHSKEDESYFHFTLPESNQSELTTYLKTFGPVRMLKEKHPVVMPQGKIRIILIVKENAKAEDKDQSDDDQYQDDEDTTSAPQVP